MFLTKNNMIKWKWLAVAFVITVILCLAGVFWLDQPLYLLLRNFDWAIWGYFDRIFDGDLWFVVTGFLVLVLYMIRTWSDKKAFLGNIKKFKIWALIKDFFIQVKNSYVFYIFSSVCVASIIGFILKIIIGRARPVFFEALGQTGFYPMNMDWAFHSMPSGHATASFAALVMIGLLAPRIKWLTWTLAIVIGISRVCHGAHFPSDVLLGAFIGMTVADFIKRFLAKLNVIKKDTI